MTEYTKTNWVDEVLQSAERFNIKDSAGNGIDAFADLTGCQIVLATPVTTPGTPVEALKLNKIEQGIHDAQDTADAAAIPVKNRQGGSATNWDASGTTNYVPATVKMQVGNNQYAPGGKTVTFPVAFSAIPIVLLTADADGLNVWATVMSVTATGFTFHIMHPQGTSPWFIEGTVLDSVNWLAIGPA